MREKKIKRRLKWQGRIALQLAFASILVFSLAGCSHMPKQLTTAQQRHRDITMLQKNGVQVLNVGQNFTLVFPSSELFVNRTPRITPNFKPILWYAADFIRTYHTINVKVAGFSDETSPEFKTKLGSFEAEVTRLQAHAVAKYLWSRNINARLIYSVGEGGRHPIAWNGSPVGRYLNRRVQVSFRYYKNNTAWY